jgi:large subunit ribosomal protein L17
MRHRVFGQKLGRDINSRKALLRNLSSSTLLSGHVVTTEAKAKFVRVYLEKLIRNTQKNSLVSKRDAASVLSQKAFLRLILEIAPGLEGRSGGYTRITKLNRRRGDDAPMAKIEIVEWDKSKTLKPKPAGKKPATIKKNESK